ncbi:MAG: type II toxin-antitoxin system YhaV family toxin [Cyanobacteria bacterium SZAS LIN-2]|nr:type II toxin-antitoxin system YhaV family toxin [Cyanobacteria bacterium SZAS LIN-2]
MIVNGWRLFQYKLFTEQLNKLSLEVRGLQQARPADYRDHPKVKRLARIKKLILEEIPADPAHPQWNQGNTLGPEFRLWKRAKFGKNRFRLFFRFDSKRKVIIYAWVNDENTLRKDGDKNDPYALFSRGLQKGDPPADLDEILKRCSEFSEGS